MWQEVFELFLKMFWLVFHYDKPPLESIVTNTIQANHSPYTLYAFTFQAYKGWVILWDAYIEVKFL